MAVKVFAFAICALALSASSPILDAVFGGRTAQAQQMGSPARLARQPYTASYETTQVRTLSDRSTVTRQTTVVVAVDAQGRRMTATTWVAQAGQARKTHIAVFNPIAHTRLSWVSPGNEVTVSAMPIRATMPCPSGAAEQSIFIVRPGSEAKPLSVKSTVEDLGIETIQGVEARGKRTTTTIPAGAVRNSEPLVRTVELWTAVAPGLRGMVAREVIDDPQSGKTAKELVRFNETEPDPSVFRVPPRYKIVNREVKIDACTEAEEFEPAAPSSQ